MHTEGGTASSISILFDEFERFTINLFDVFGVLFKQYIGPVETINIWNHYVWTYDAGAGPAAALQVYRDGVNITNTTVIKFVDIAGSGRSNEFFTYRFGALSTQRWAGKIYSPATWDVTLTGAEVTELLAADSVSSYLGDFGDYVSSQNLVNYWDFRVISNRTDDRVGDRNLTLSTVTPGDTDVPPSFEQMVSVDMDGGVLGHRFRNNTQVTHGMGNAWTIMKRFKTENGPTNQLYLFLDMRGAVSTPFSGILIRIQRTGGARILEVFVWDENGTSRKWYQADGFFGEPVENPKWNQLFVTWDGTNLKIWNAEVGNSVVEHTSITKLQDDAITMVNNSTRDLTLPGLPQAHYHELAMWARDLSEAEMNEIIQGGGNEYRLKANNGVYLAANDLVHWWRWGLDSGDIGADYADAGFDFDMMLDATGINSGDIVDPSWPSE
jgi:hypothetical protein